MKLYRSLFFIAGSLLLVVLIASGFAPAVVDEEPIGEIGSEVVPFELPTYDGGTFTTDKLAGKVTLLVFWFST